jgi:hypothetical protein
MRAVCRDSKQLEIATRRSIAPEGPRSALARLSSLSSPSQVAVTGSFAAGRIAPVAAPALLLAYATDVAATADALKLLPADEGANVILLRPYDEAVWSRLDSDDDIAFVVPSQTVADCLTGTGRMPAEGDALLAWMVDNECSWRAPSLRDAIEERLKCRAEASPKGRRTRVGGSSKV